MRLVTDGPTTHSFVELQPTFDHENAGRNMDADGVSFGDFGGGRGGATSTAQQDLMDTWYPDCRECACCKVLYDEIQEDEGAVRHQPRKQL